MILMLLLLVLLFSPYRYPRFGLYYRPFGFRRMFFGPSYFRGPGFGPGPGFGRGPGHHGPRMGGVGRWH
ncbi:MAG: hypothetical protein IJM15_05745 [Erysipelotrichaceae bacterium]|nr:hypothetical protein [Erysipelotrichaceae bacterium]